MAGTPPFPQVSWRDRRRRWRFRLRRRIRATGRFDRICHGV